MMIFPRKSGQCAKKAEVDELEIQPDQRPATRSERNPAYEEVTNRTEPGERSHPSATQVKGMNPDIFVTAGGQGLVYSEASKAVSDKASAR